MKKICLVAALLLAALVPASQAQTAGDKSVDIDYDCTDVTSSLGVNQVMPLSAAIYIPAERAAAYAAAVNGNAPYAQKLLLFLVYYF